MPLKPSIIYFFYSKDNKVVTPCTWLKEIKKKNPLIKVNFFSFKCNQVITSCIKLWKDWVTKTNLKWKINLIKRPFNSWKVVLSDFFLKDKIINFLLQSKTAVTFPHQIPYVNVNMICQYVNLFTSIYIVMVIKMLIYWLSCQRTCWHEHNDCYCWSINPFSFFLKILRRRKLWFEIWLPEVPLNYTHVGAYTFN